MSQIFYVYLSESDQDNPSVDVYATEEQAMTRFINDLLEDDEIEDEEKEGIRLQVKNGRSIELIYESVHDIYEASREEGCNDSYYHFEPQEFAKAPKLQTHN